MPSITYWNRLEPTSRAADLVPPLAARIHDPLWFLTRQWQLGEFRGEESRSPAWIEVHTTSRPMVILAAPNHLQAINADAPLEKLTAATLPIDLATSVELGQTFEWMLNDPALVPAFRNAYPVAPASPAEQAAGDADLLRFRAFFTGRALHGAALFQAAVAASPSLPPQPPVPAARQAQVLAALQKWMAHVRELFGGAPGTAAPAWNPAQLAYEYDVSPGGTAAYAVRPGADGEATWESFSAKTLSTPLAPAPPPEQTKVTRLPASVRFRGMPARAFWSFDSRALDYGAVEIERRDVAKLVLHDVLMLHGDQWYLVPLEQKVGTVMTLDAVLVRDVFGELTLIPPVPQGWSMFRTSGPPSPGLLFPATATAAVQYGAPVAETRFVRDDMMNMAWAIEHVTTGALGQPLQGHDRSLLRAAASAPPPQSTQPSPPRYTLRPPAPEHWVPYVPVQGAQGIQLERAAAAAQTPPRLAEEQVRNPSVRVQHVIARSRGFRGHTYLWIAARRSVAPPETTSPPRFDRLIVDAP